MFKIHKARSHPDLPPERPIVSGCGSIIKSKTTGEVIKYTGDFSCTTVGVVYLITCTKCKMQYIGQTARKFSVRMREHILSIENCEDKIIGTHFNSQGHSLDNFSVQIIEKVCPNEPHFLLERERWWILKFRTTLPLGLNSHV